MDLARIELVGDQLEDVVVEGFRVPTAGRHNEKRRVVPAPTGWRRR